MKSIRSQIIGCGSYLPENRISNHDMTHLVDTTNEWIVERTGIEFRHFAHRDQKASDLATLAAQEALKNAGITPADIDLIVVATSTPDDNTFPSTAVSVQAKLGCKNAFAFDVSAVCSGYLVALSTADNYIRTGQAKTALVIGAEKLSDILDMEDRRTCVLFGDGAGAVVLRAEETTDERGVLGVYMHSDGDFRDILYLTDRRSESQKPGVISMEGREVFRHAVTKLTESANRILARHNITCEDIDWFIPHQANIRIINAIAQKLNLPQEKIIITVDQHANTSAASIPLALSEAINSGRVKRGDLILHEAIGAGLVWGSALVRY
jgi:3-oxoacyl-[acyl-carrier-protein] synthase III